MTHPHEIARSYVDSHSPRRRSQAASIKRNQSQGVGSAALAFALLAIGALILVGAVLAAAARSGADVVSRFIPGWPWW